MRATRLLNRTLFDDPADAELRSHKLMARGGFIRKVGAGIYSYGPLMWRTLKKISAIVREEMDRAGAQEVLLPILQPLELWQESGRADAYIKAGIMFHLQDRKDAGLCLGPTAEEAVTDLVRGAIESWKQLPVTVYQIGNKYRDEFRPRFGLMRGREFIMKDAYSFDADDAGLDASYKAMREAYVRIFDRCGLRYVVVEADSGAIGGSRSEEFMVTADAGEDALLTCPHCGYGANVERAESVLPPGEPGGPPRPLRNESTPGVTTVDALAKFFDLSPTRMVKTVLFEATYKSKVQPLAVLIRGDVDCNPVKVQNAAGALALAVASEDLVRKATGAEPGFAGPVGLKDTRILADTSVQGMTNFLCGANQTDRHLLDVNFERDVPLPKFAEMREARVGDTCARCKTGKLEGLRGIEVGHVFKLGTKYSESMKALYADKDGKRRPFVMGCYGIGVSRIAAAAVEQNHDDKGIVWPAAIAPMECVIVPMQMDQASVVQAAEKLYVELQRLGVETLLDDRDARPGPKLKDSELLGFPFRVLCGRSLSEGKVEIERRAGGEKELVALEDAAKWVADALAREKSQPKRAG
ncbi:MAG TPA: proline--tRNA ligase [Planctomycetota bacterium]|nr:proline--tRNA ligase [Planctomycetota bacterium]